MLTRVGRPACFIGLLAVALGLVGTLKPALVLKLPAPAGFLLYAFFGGNGGRLPPYVINSLFWPIEHFEAWVRPRDVFVVAGAKSGSTWMCYCADAVRRRGGVADLEGLTPWVDPMYNTPWMDFIQYPGYTWAGIVEGFNTATVPFGTGPDGRTLDVPLSLFWNNPNFPFRIFKSHHTPIAEGNVTAGFTDVIPVKQLPDVKYISVVRNVYEVFASMYEFVAAHRQEFKDEWGGFPPNYPNMNAAAKDLLPGGHLYIYYFPVVRAWWRLRSEKNLLIMHYRDMVEPEKGLDMVVEKLSTFMLDKEPPLNADETSAVKELCSSEHMTSPELRGAFDYRIPLHPDPVWKTMGALELGGIHAKLGRDMKRSGQKARKEGKDSARASGLSEELIKMIDSVLETELPDPEMRNWALYGSKMAP